MQTENDKPQTSGEQAKEKHTDFFEKREMNAEVNDADNAGDDSFTPIYLNDDSVLQTREEKQHDERVDAQKNDTMEAINIDATETTFDKMNNEATNDFDE